MVNKTHEIITKQNLIKPREFILVTISGGQDSICLFFILLQLKRQWKWNFGVLYCNHFWQINAFYTSSIILNLSFLFLIPTYLSLPSENIFSEKKSRNWRYYQFKRLSFFYKYGIITTAHTATDRIETTFFQLIRGTGTRGLSLLNWRKSIANLYSIKPELHFNKKIFVLYFCTILLYKFQTHFQTCFFTPSVQKTPGLFYRNKQIWVILHETTASLNALSNRKVLSFALPEKSLKLRFFLTLKNSSSHLNYVWKKTKHHLLSSNIIWIYNKFIFLTTENLEILKNSRGALTSQNLFFQNKQNKDCFLKNKSRYKKTMFLPKKNFQLKSRAITTNLFNRYNYKKIEILLSCKIRAQIVIHFFLFKFCFSVFLKLPKKISSNFHLSFFKTLIYLKILNPVSPNFWPKQTPKFSNLFTSTNYTPLTHLPLKKRFNFPNVQRRSGLFYQNKQGNKSRSLTLFFKDSHLLDQKAVFLTSRPSKILIKFMTVPYWSTFKNRFSKKNILHFACSEKITLLSERNLNRRDASIDALIANKKNKILNSCVKKKLILSLKNSSYCKKNIFLITNYCTLSNTQKIKIINIILKTSLKIVNDVILETFTWNLQTCNKQNLIINLPTNNNFFYAPLFRLEEEFYSAFNIFLYALMFEEQKMCSIRTSKAWTKQFFVRGVKLALSINFTAATLNVRTPQGLLDQNKQNFIKKRKLYALHSIKKRVNKSVQELIFQTFDNKIKFACSDRTSLVFVEHLEMKYSIFFSVLYNLSLQQPYFNTVKRKSSILEKTNPSHFFLRRNLYQKNPFKQVNKIHSANMVILNLNLYFIKNILSKKFNPLKKSKVQRNRSFLALSKKQKLNFYQKNIYTLNNKRRFLLQTCEVNLVSNCDVDYALTSNTFSLVLVQHKCKSIINSQLTSKPGNFDISKNILVSLNKLNHKNVFLIRPLLFVNRFDLRKLCTFWQLPVYPDKTNENLNYYRNRIRKQLLPLLRFFFNPQIDKIFLQFSELANSEEIYLNLAATRLKYEFQIKKDPIFLKLEMFEKHQTCYDCSERTNLVSFGDLERTTQFELKKNCFLNRIYKTPSLFSQNQKLVKHQSYDFKSKAPQFEVLLKSMTRVPNSDQFFIQENQQKNSDFDRKQLNLCFFKFLPIAIRRRILKQFLNDYFPQKLKFLHIETLLQQISKTQSNQFHFYRKLFSTHDLTCQKNLQIYKKLNIKLLLVSVLNKAKKQSLNQNYWTRRPSLFCPLPKNSFSKVKKIKINFSKFYFKKFVYEKLKFNYKHQKFFSSSHNFEQFQLFFFPKIGVFLILSTRLVAMPNLKNEPKL